MTARPLTGAEELRSTVALLNNCREDFNDRFSALELLTLALMYRSCGWDIPPDHWTERQLHEALTLGRPPCWDSEERPKYGKRETLGGRV